MSGPFDRYAVVYFATVIALILVAVAGLLSGQPIEGVG